MSLYTELQSEVSGILSDPEIKTGDVRIRRVTSTTPGANPWNPPTEVVQIIQLEAVVFPAEAEYVNGTLVTERGDEITASALATVVEEGGVAVNRRITLDVRDSDEFFVDGDSRRVARVKKTPGAGDVVAWSVRVVD